MKGISVEPSKDNPEADGQSTANARRAVRQELLPQTRCGCGGLDFPRLPHLHAENCPARDLAVTLYREDATERRQFDQLTDLSGGEPLRRVASALDMWGRMNRGGSFSEQCFIMANECLMAAETLARGNGSPSPANTRDGSTPQSSEAL